MKKTLIPAALILAISLVPCVPTLTCLADPAASATSILTSSLFWHLIGAFRARELARLAAAPRPNHAAEFVPAAASLVTPGVVDFVVRHLIGSTRAPSTPQNCCASVSISACLVRRIVEREIKTIREESAGRQPSHSADHHKEKVS